MPYLPGTLPANPGPLARYLPPLEEGVVTRWLKAHLPPGSWILDPFGSAPRLTLEAARAGYRVLVTVNNPVLFFVIQVMAEPPSEAEFTAALATLAAARKGDERLETHLQSLYRTTCEACGRNLIAEGYLWRKGEAAPFARRYTCPSCGDKGERTLQAGDLELIQTLQSADALHRARALERVAPLHDPHRETVAAALEHYLPRPLYVLTTLINRLQTLNLTPMRRRALEALLISLCDRGNDLWSQSGERLRPRQLTTPPTFTERNLWSELETGIAQWLDHASPVPCKIWPQLPPESGGICLFRGRVRDFAQHLTTASPFAAALTALPRPNQAFWTLCALWAGWLWGAEAVEPFKIALERRHYDWAWQAAALRAAFTVLHRFLESGQPFFALLSEAEPPALTAALLAAQSSGFRLQELTLRTPDDPIQITWERKSPPPATPPDPEQTRAALTEFLRARGEPATYLHLHAAALQALEGSGALSLPPGEPADEALRRVQRHIQETIRTTCHHWSAHESPESGLWGLTEMPSSPSLGDTVERLLVQHLQKHPLLSFAEVEEVIYPHFSGLQTPSRGLLYAVLRSYAERKDGLWQLRPEDTASARRAALRQMAQHLHRLAERLGYAVRPLDAATWLWMETTEVHWLVHLQASAQSGWLFTAPPAKQRLLVIPGGRAGLLTYKAERDPRLAEHLRTWEVLKFRHLRLIAEIPLLTRQTFAEQLRLDPLEHSPSQMMLF